MRWHEMVKKGEVAHESRRPTGPEHIPVSVAYLKQMRVLLLPPGVLEAPLESIAGLPCSSMSLVPIFYTPGWRETMWGKVSCLRKQHDGRDWVSNHRPTDLRSNVLATTPLSVPPDGMR